MEQLSRDLAYKATSPVADKTRKLAVDAYVLLKEYFGNGDRFGIFREVERMEIRDGIDRDKDIGLGTMTFHWTFQISKNV